MQPQTMESRKMRGSALAASAMIVALLVVAVVRGEAGDRRYTVPGIVPLDGRLDVAGAKSFERMLARAQEAKCDIVVIDIDVNQGTPDGTRTACDAIRKIRTARTVAYVQRRALGPGAAAAMCCDEWHLASDAVVGDLSSLVGDGVDRSEWTTLLEGWMKERRRPVELVRRMAGDSEKAAAVFRGREAVTERLADRTAESHSDVFGALGIKAAPQSFAKTWVDDTVAVLNHPVATTALVVTGLVFLYVELATAGIGLATLPALLCFMLFFWAKFLGGTAGWLEMVLFIAGLICLLLEIFVIPGFGVVGAAGIALLVFSLVMATQGFLLPRTPADGRIFLQTIIQWSAGGLLFVAAAAAVTKRIGGLPVVKQFVLEPTENAAAAAVDGAVIPTRMNGVAATDLRPAGKARFGNQLIDVVTDGFYIPAGTEVRIVDSSPTRVQVTKV